MEVESNGGIIWYDVVGNGPALLVPGHASSPRFRVLAEQFSDDYTVIGHDLRDTSGLTKFPPEAFTVDDLADDCVAVLQACGFERCHYLGLSHTGVLGLSFALRYPDQLDCLALTMTTPGGVGEVSADPSIDAIADRNLSTTGELADAMVKAQSGDPDGPRMLAALSYSKSAAEKNPALVDAKTELIFGPSFALPADVKQRFWSALGRFSARDRLGEITAPTLVMVGGDDRMVEITDSWIMWRGIPNATLVGLDDVGHDWYAEAPEVGARVVKAFLRGEYDTPHK